MFGNLAAKLFGSRNERLIRKMMKSVQAINALEAQMEALTDDEVCRS